MIRKILSGKIFPRNSYFRFLMNICFHENSRTTNSKLMKEYIEKQNALEELISWTVVLINKPKAKNHYPIGKYNIGLTVRNPDSNRNDLYAIKKSQIISPPDEFIDLSEEEIQNALNNMKNDPDRIERGDSRSRNSKWSIYKRNKKSVKRASVNLSIGSSSNYQGNRPSNWTCIQFPS